MPNLALIETERITVHDFTLKTPLSPCDSRPWRLSLAFFQLVAGRHKKTAGDHGETADGQSETASRHKAGREIH
jgi:hypothetical protein